MTVNELRLLSSKMMAVSSLRSGKRCFISESGGPTLPGESPPLMSWQVRQLPLLRSNASFSPSEAGACAQARPPARRVGCRQTGQQQERASASASIVHHASFIEAAVGQGNRDSTTDAPVTPRSTRFRCISRGQATLHGGGVRCSFYQRDCRRSAQRINRATHARYLRRGPLARAGWLQARRLRQVRSTKESV